MSKQTLLKALILVCATLPALTPAETIKGVLMDRMCSSKADLHLVPPPGMMEGGMVVAEAHTRECALMPACEKSGYGVYTQDNKFYTFDPASNAKAVAAIKASKKLADLEVEITGEIKGDTLKIATLKLLD